MKEIQTTQHRELLLSGIPIKTKNQSDKVINYFLISFYCVGLLLSFFYDTWLIGVGVGSLSLLAYYSTKYLLPDSNLYQYVLSVVFGFFMAQYIYQMHGLFEMHFMAFVGSTMLITYKNWKLQIPLAIVVTVHHTLFNYLQYLGFREIYFTQLPYLDLQTLFIHGVLANIIFGICGLWAYQFSKYSAQIERINEDLAAKKQELQMANADLERSNNDLMQFASVASHDLKEPLRKIQSYTDLISSRYKEKLDDNGQKYFRYILESASRMKLLIEDILKYSKLSASASELSKINLKELIESIISDLEVPIKEKGAEFQIGSLGEIEGIPGQIRQVFQNLISNSLKFTSPKRRPVISISFVTGSGKEFGFKNTNPYCRIEVSDNGIGFDMKHSDSIFTLFNRLHSKDKYEGSGIGLSVVKKIIEKHNGFIAAESIPGEGSKFILFLPIIPSELKINNNELKINTLFNKKNYHEV